MEDYLPINEVVTFAPKEREKKVRDFNKLKLWMLNLICVN